MNKILLIWNLVLTILLLGTVLNACGPQYDLAAEVRSNRQAIEQLSALVNANRAIIDNNTQTILANKVAIDSLAQTTQATMNALSSSLTQYFEQYIRAYVDQVIATK